MAKPGKKGKGRKGKKGGLLYSPNQPISGRPLNKVATALTNIETRPGINAQKSLIGSINRGARRDIAALGAMGNRLNVQSGNLVDRMATEGNRSVATATTNRDQLNERLVANARSSQDSLNQLQSSVLGDQISTLASQRVQPSESQGRLAQFAQMQQQANAANSSAYSDVGAVLGSGALANAAMQRQASIDTAGNQQLDIARNIASRQNDTRAQASEARRAAQAELATLRSLKGATKTKNLLDLRREQQQFQLGRAELAQAGRQARAELGIENRKLGQKDRELDIDQQKANQDGRDGGSGNESRDALRLGPAEYRQYSAAAKEYLGGGKIGNYGEFLNKVAKLEGVNWEPVERRKFRKRFKKKNPGLFS